MILMILAKSCVSCHHVPPLTRVVCWHFVPQGREDEADTDTEPDSGEEDALEASRTSQLFNLFALTPHMCSHVQTPSAWCRSRGEERRLGQK